MSQHAADSSLLATFSWLWENDDFILPETVVVSGGQYCRDERGTYLEADDAEAENKGTGASNPNHKSAASRAKTDAEKEQRRIERVLRNRAAAQSSRERKQNEMESLKTERARLAESNSELKAQLLSQEATHTALCRELEQMKQTLRRYEEFQKVEARAPDPPMDEDEDLFLFPNSEVAAPGWTVDPRILNGRAVPGQTESILSLNLLA
ncbi:hypothetical protein HOY82DRAFT_602377 [Tuber indicum]|nr:hypothetical protein HOY82DRAFT_602377 [Tuber indicum]